MAQFAHSRKDKTVAQFAWISHFYVRSSFGGMLGDP
jgi:hypothetical protein